MKRLRTFLFVIVLVLSGMGCGIFSAPLLTPSPAATAVPTATLVPTTAAPTTAAPTATTAPTATAVPTAESPAAPSPTATSMFSDSTVPETEIIVQPNGSMIFYDHRAGFNLTIPENWLIINQTESKLDSIIDQAMLDYPLLADRLEFVRKSFNKDYRFVAFDVDKTHFQGGTSPMIETRMIDSNDTGDNFPLEQIRTVMEKSIAEDTPNAKVIFSAVETNQSGVEMIRIDMSSNFKTDTGQVIKFFERHMIYQMREILLLTNIIIPDASRDQRMPVLDQIMDSIKYTQ